MSGFAPFNYRNLVIPFVTRIRAGFRKSSSFLAVACFERQKSSETQQRHARIKRSQMVQSYNPKHPYIAALAAFLVIIEVFVLSNMGAGNWSRPGRADLSCNEFSLLASPNLTARLS